jgi:hypothetical protein
MNSNVPEKHHHKHHHKKRKRRKDKDMEEFKDVDDPVVERFNEEYGQYLN